MRKLAAMTIVVAIAMMGCAQGMTPYQDNVIQTGQIAGGALGAIAGYVLGDTRGALIGGAAGVALGSAGGRIVAEQQEGFPSRQQIATYQQQQQVSRYYMSGYNDTYWYMSGDNMFNCRNPRRVLVRSGGWCESILGGLRSGAYQDNNWWQQFERRQAQEDRRDYQDQGNRRESQRALEYNLQNRDRFERNQLEQAQQAERVRRANESRVQYWQTPAQPAPTGNRYRGGCRDNC